MPPPYSDAQLRAELARCQSCEAKPCRSGCPANVSPADFLLAARSGAPSDLRRAAAHVLAHNPLGGVCGSVCPDTLCMARCARRGLDAPVEIPALQAEIVRRARRLGDIPHPARSPATGQRVAVVGAGPAGLGAASVLARAGHAVHVFDRARRAGGMARLIPRRRLDPEVLAADVAWLLGLGEVRLVLGRAVSLPRDLLARGFAAVVVTAGLGAPAELEVPGAALAVPWAEVLGPRPPSLRGRRVAVVGDGAVALDCVEAALAQGAAHVELFARRALSELELGRRDRERLFGAGVHVSCRVRVAAIRGRGARVTALALRKLELPAGQAFHPSRLVDLPHGDHERRDLDTVVLALGAVPGLRREPHPRIVYAGDLESGPSSVVEALASGKRAALEVHRLLAGAELAACPDRGSCADGSGCPKRATCPEWNRVAPAEATPAAARAAPGLPVSLRSEFFGRPVASPFLLPAGPLTEGRARTRRAYEAGWPGAVVTAASLDRLCEDLAALRREFPDRLTLARLAVAASKDVGADARAWEEGARRLEAAGALGVECELPADPGRAARIVEAVLAGGDPQVPRLLAVSGAAPEGALAAVAAALARRPDRRAGVTLPAPASAGTPSGIDDAALAAIAGAARRGLFVSGRGDLRDHRGAASALARGAGNVQLGAVAARHGLGVIGELEAGLSHLLAERGLRSVAALVGRARDEPEAPPGGLVCAVDPGACTGCGNCTRCLAAALSLGARGAPAVDAGRCTGCGACVERCFVGALALVERGTVPAARA